MPAEMSTQENEPEGLIVIVLAVTDNSCLKGVKPII
jgi:hypothetical protein